MRCAVGHGLLLLLSTLVLGERASAAEHLVVIIADDLGWGDVGYHGSEISTPTIDMLAAEGVRLERFYVHPVCSTTRGALLTGRSPIRTGVLMPFEPWYADGPPLSEVFMPVYLKEAGFQTFAIGKWHLGPNRSSFHPQARGFDHFYGHLGGFINYDLHTIWRGIDWQRNGQTVTEDGYSTKLITDEAVRLIQTRDERARMFLYLSYNAPHSPLQAPQDAIEQYRDLEAEERRIFAAMVSEMDRGIERVLSTLDDEGILDETLVLFMSDNGGNPNLGASNGQLRGQKAMTWEGGIRVPAVLWSAEDLPSGSAFDQILSVEDLLPTLFEGLGLSFAFEIPIDGINMWPAINGRGQAPERVRVLTWHNRSDYLSAVFEGEWKLVKMPNEQSGQLESYLFRISEDPYEQNDLAAQYPEVVSRLEVRLSDFPRAPIIGLNDEPVPTITGLGGPASPMPDNSPPDREPYAESAVQD
jgi:arylsulfatase B